MQALTYLRSIVLGASFVFLLAACGNGDSEPAAPEVLTAYGPVRGFADAEYGSIEFRGIPYAAPPVGDLRWAPTQPPESWTEVLDATQFGAECPRKADPGESTSEDCLTVNVVTPDLDPAEPAPVMVWIHGGSRVSGGSDSEWYIGGPLAQRNGVVVVTFNYRLDLLGYLAHPALGSPSGDYAIMDQQALLRWVRDNIAAFGGDPGKVTLFGLSSGSQDVCVHIAAPDSAGLFHRAAMESGACDGPGYATRSDWLLSLAEAEAQGQLQAERVGCGDAPDVAACLRGKEPGELLDRLAYPDPWLNSGEAIWAPVVGGAVLPGLPLDLIEAGQFNQVPVIMGVTKDDASFWFEPYQFLTEGIYLAGLAEGWGDDADAIAAEYPVANYESPAHAASDVATDFTYAGPMRRSGRAMAAHGVPVYFWHLTYAPTSVRDPFLGAFHTAVCVLVFHSAHTQDTPSYWNGPFTPESEALSYEVMDYWTRFARTGDPNGDGAVTWPLFTSGTDEYLILDTTIESATHFKQAKLDFWDNL